MVTKSNPKHTDTSRSGDLVEWCSQDLPCARYQALEAELVAEIVAMIHEQFDAPHIIDAGRKVAAMIEAKFGGTNG